VTCCAAEKPAAKDRLQEGEIAGMSLDISERAFENAIEAALIRGVRHGAGEETLWPDDEGLPQGGYRKRHHGDYDRALCLLPDDVADFVLATQPKQWKKLSQHYGAEAEARFMRRLSSEISRRGTLDVLRRGIKDMGCAFRLVYFRPSSGMNDEMRRLHACNIFTVVRQLHYSEKNQNSIDLGLFLNGLPIFTAELKNPLTGQNVEDAIAQYKTGRDPREPLLKHGRCLAHFAVDPHLAYVTTHLSGAKTRFLPFNQGRFGGAGNPPVSPTQTGYATAYLWEETWARDSVLDLVRQFIHEVEEDDDKGRKTGRKFLLFPRYQQLDCVRRLVSDAREKGAGKHYLIQHSAGSGKTFTISWLAHQLSTLHDFSDQRVFDSIVVVSDRRVIDRHLQSALRQFERTLGVVENIDKTSAQLKQALEGGKTIVVTTLQKFPVIASQIGELPGKRFALIVDEAHSSQSGESSKSLKSVLAVSSLDEAESEDAVGKTPEEELDERAVAEMERRGRLSNLSVFAFTATPKPKTLELFGTRRDDGSFAPFHLYSMRQAIEEGFILDVLANYTTYETYWRLLKTIEDDPRYEKIKAAYLLKSFVDLHPHAISEKVGIMLDHFAAKVQSNVEGAAKAMIVTRSRLHAVRYKMAADHYLAQQGLPFEALVAFSGTVKDGGKSYTEAGMNGFPEAQTAKKFESPGYRFLIVANKFQTGFDQPLLQAMYVDKKLGGVNAVQTLSRLNRTHPSKQQTVVLDFANEADHIKAAFEPYYETTLLSEGTDPNLLYEIQTRLDEFPVYAQEEIDRFAAVCFSEEATQDRLYAELAPVAARIDELANEEKRLFRKSLTEYVRLYAFLAQVLVFSDPDLEKFYVFARHLRRFVHPERDELPLEVQQNIDMESYRIQQTASGSIQLDRKAGRLDPAKSKGPRAPASEELEPLSRIIAELNERFGVDLGPEHRVTLGQMMEKLDSDDSLDAAARVNTRDNVRLTFDHKVEKVIQQIVDSNFDLYKRITDDRPFGELIKNLLFDQYVRNHRNAEELIKQGESRTLEFKSTLRWNLKEERKDGRITYAAVKTIAAFLNTEGGDLLLGVADDGSIAGIEQDRFDSDDKFMLHLAQAVRTGLGDRAGTCIDPRIQLINGKAVCAVGCQRSPEPVFLKWKGVPSAAGGDFFVRTGPGTVKLSAADAQDYIRTRF